MKEGKRYWKAVIASAYVVTEKGEERCLFVRNFLFPCEKSERRTLKILRQ